MLKLTKTMRAYGTPDFEATLKQELMAQPSCLPLQQELAQSSSVADTPITVMIIGVAETEAAIRVKAGIYYQGVVGGCSCADDPSSTGENNEYCVVQLEIDRQTADTSIALSTEG